jgi:predicted nucleic acid-binding protein
MSVLIDTNILLDVALKREPFYQASALALAKARGLGDTLLCAISVTTLHYFLRQKLGEKGARLFLDQCVNAMTVAKVEKSTLQAALTNPMTDFEDGVIAQAALAYAASLILTRNPKDFIKSPVPALSPEDYLKQP